MASNKQKVIAQIDDFAELHNIEISTQGTEAELIARLKEYQEKYANATPGTGDDGTGQGTGDLEGTGELSGTGEGNGELEGTELLEGTGELPGSNTGTPESAGANLTHHFARYTVQVSDVDGKALVVKPGELVVNVSDKTLAELKKSGLVYQKD